MDEQRPPQPLEDRMVAATERQKDALRGLELTGQPMGADLMAIVARQRLIKRLLIRAGLVVDLETGAPAQADEAEILFVVLEAEAKAEVLEDLLAGARGTPNDRVRLVVPTATRVTDDDARKAPH